MKNAKILKSIKFSLVYTVFLAIITTGFSPPKPVMAIETTVKAGHTNQLICAMNDSIKPSTLGWKWLFDKYFIRPRSLNKDEDSLLNLYSSPRDNSQSAPSERRKRCSFPTTVTLSFATLSMILSLCNIELANAATRDKGVTRADIESEFTKINWNDEIDSLRPSNFRRLNESPDLKYYAQPRFVEHIDKSAVQSLIKFHRDQIKSLVEISPIHAVKQNSLKILDLCSSHVSHLPPEFFQGDLKPLLQPPGSTYQTISVTKNIIPSFTMNVIGLGMNEEELAANPQLNSYVVKDLNSDPRLPFEDGTFDAVLVQLSIDYLTQPVSVMKEVGRVLRPEGGVYIR